MSKNECYKKCLSRLAEQYQDSSKFLKLIKLYCKYFQEIKDCFIYMLEKRDIDNGEGKQLDIIGDITGQKRITLTVENEHFRYRLKTDKDTHKGYTSLYNHEYGAPFRSLNDREPVPGKSDIIEDKLFRILLRARVAKNTAVASEPESLIIQVKNITQAKNICFETGGAWISFSIGTLNTRNLEILLKVLDLIPKPSTYKLIFLAKHNPDNYFNFSARTELQPSSKGRGFGSLHNPDIGGKFGTIIYKNK